MIYAVLATGTCCVKFGVATDVQKRLEMLQIGCPFELEVLAVCPGGLKEEASIHSRLLKAKEHIRGEWFKYGYEAAQIIREMKERNLNSTPAGVIELRIANRRIRLQAELETRRALSTAPRRFP